VHARIVATDLNQPMLGHAAAKQSHRDNITWRQADALALPFKDQEFDVVACQFGVMFFPDKEKSYREAHRVLIPGGRYLFSVWDEHRFNPAPRLVHELLAGLFPDDPPGFYEVPFAYHRLDPVREAVTAAGFTDFGAAVRHIDKVVPDPAVFARGLIYGNPVIEQIRLRGGDPDRVVEAVAGAVRREFGDPPRIPLQVIFFEAARP
jgi:SAM-dependent methyltransferase